MQADEPPPRVDPVQHSALQAEWLRITLESIADAVICTDANGCVTLINAAAEAMTGFKRNEAIGRPLASVFTVIDESTGRPIEDPAAHSMRVHRSVVMPKWASLAGRDGRRRLIEDTASPIVNVAGESVGSVLVFHDVTDRRREEAEREQLLGEVEAARKRLFEAFERSPSFMAVLRGPEHVIELANDRFRQLVGAREITGKTVREALPELVEQGLVTLLDDAYRGGEVITVPEISLRLRRSSAATAEKRSVEFVYQPLRNLDGSVSAVLVQGIDITGRKRAEAAAMERDERLRLLIDHATDYALIVTDPQSRITEWKGGAERITGWSEQEVLGHDSDILFTPRDIVEGAADKERQGAIDNGRADDKRWHRRKDGSLFFADGVMTSLWSPSGELKGFGKVVRDVTERKVAEEEAQQADQRKDEFIALLAHELRNPLAPIRSGLQVIRLSPNDPETVEQARAMMDRQLGHMVRLIDDLLDVSRISQSKMELRRTRVTLADVVAHGVETSRPVIEAAGHELVITLPDEPVVLDADLTRLAQVMSNLLTNSAKYTDRGGRIEVAARRRGEEVLISVTDNGAGIGAEALPHVFDMFSQAGASMERSRGGLGIGLALVRGLVEMHGGEVTAESPGPGRGSTFTVALPVAPPLDESAPVSIRTLGDANLRAAKVLVVDDNVDAARSMARVLSLLGNEVKTAHDGVEALETAATQHPDVILMDIAMPRMNGYDATRHIREQPWGDEPVIVALTGWGLESDRERSREAGCDAHLVKPVELGELESVLESLMGRRADRGHGGAPGRL